MSPEEWLQKARLRYVVDVYLPDLTKEYLARRCRDNCTSQEQDRIRRYPLLQATDFFRFVDQRAIVSYFELRPPALKPAFVRVIANILVREHAVASGAEDPQFGLSGPALTEFILYGNGSPFAIFHDSPVAASELSFEHRTAPVSPETADSDQRARAVAFLRGGRPLDWDVMRDVAIARPLEDELLNAIMSEQLVILTGSAGDGKSTILKRVALALRIAGWRVLMTEPPSRRRFPSVKVLGSSAERTCLLVDNADLASGFPDLESELLQAPNLRVVLCARSYQWERKRFVFNRKLVLSVPTIGGDEIESLVERLLAWRASGRPRTPEELKSAILRSVQSEHPHLLAAMMTATHGVSFQTIIDRMIDEFEDANEQWALRLVACGALLEEISHGQVGKLPGPIFLAIVAQRLNPAASGGDRLSEFARARLRAFASEIVTHKAPVAHAASQYDLRHPDIVNQVLHRYFGLRWGEAAGDINLIADDLYEIIQAEFASLRSSRRGEHDDWLNYTGTAVRAYFRFRAQETGWIPPGLVRETTRSMIGAYGNFERQIRAKHELLLAWASFEAYLEALGKADASEQRLSDTLYDQACGLGLGDAAWNDWARSAMARGSLGAWDLPEPTSARGIYRRAWDEGVRSPALLSHWMRFEANDGHLGDLETPAEKSARWLAQWAWNEGIRNRQLLEQWIQIESRAGNLGDADEPHRFSVRWIFRERLQAACELDDNLFLRWMHVELAEGNAGDPEEPAPHSARWLARHAWDLGMRSRGIVEASIRLEAREGNLGDLNDPAPHTARWLMREAGALAVESEQVVAAAIAAEDRDGNLGDFDAPEEGTARWYARRAWEHGMRGAHFLFAWGSMEGRTGNLGHFEEAEAYSARWIYRTAWQLGLRSSALIIAWLGLEQRSGAIGDDDSPAEYSFRWIGRTALAGDLLGSGWIGALMKLEQELGNIGDCSRPREFSARWVARRAWLNGARDEGFISCWAAMEAKVGNLGDFNEPAEFSARWILRQAWVEEARGSSVVALWILVEGAAGSVGDAQEPDKFTARWIARTAWGFGLRDEGVLSEWLQVEAAASDTIAGEKGTRFSQDWIAAQLGSTPTFRVDQGYAHLSHSG
jgi:hypothetical protein